MNEVYRFEDCDLLPRFRFPVSYDEFLAVHSNDIRPWWLVATQPALARMFYQLLNEELGSSRPLIPFAKLDEGNGDVACFDGSDTTGAPRIYFWAGDKSLREIEWKGRYSLDSFETWLTTVQRQRHVH